MAAQKKPPSREINLLPKEEFAASTFGRILKWLLSTFRFIVIIVEMVVMVAFLSRFWLDARSADLNDQIKQRQGIIKSSEAFEKDFRNTQTKLAIFAATTTDERKALPRLVSIASFLPSDITLDSIVLSQDNLQVKANAFSEQSIAQYITNLEASNQFQQVELQQAGTGDDTNVLTFVVKLTLKK